MTEVQVTVLLLLPYSLVFKLTKKVVTHLQHHANGALAGTDPC